MTGPSILAEFGTFDVENYGDLLYPVLFERALQKRGITDALQKFSFMGSDSLQDSRYQTRPILELFSSGRERLRALVVGGGDLLRTDWDVMASHYHANGISRKDPPPPFRWRHLLRRMWNRPMDAAARFRLHYMDYPAVGPFMIDPRRFSNVDSVAYCSCGVPFPFDTRLRHRVARTMNRSHFLYVRDRQSKDALQQAGVTREIHVAPDLVVVLSDFFDRNAERGKGRAILQKFGVDVTRNIIIVQSNPQPPISRIELAGQLLTFQKRTGCEIALLPLARCHGDHEFLEQLAEESGGAFKYVELDSIFDIIAALAACNVFLGTSLHGNITAFSFGVPHLFGPIPVAKCDGFLDVVNLPTDLKLKSWDEANQKLELAARMNQEQLTTRVSAAKQRVHEIFDLLVRAVAEPPTLPR